MYKIIGCVVVWGFAALGFSEWYSRTYREDNNENETTKNQSG